jgi:hypothetical protein
MTTKPCNVRNFGLLSSSNFAKLALMDRSPPLGVTPLLQPPGACTSAVYVSRHFKDFFWYLTSLRQGLDETVSARRNLLYLRIDIVVPGAGGGDERVGNVALLSSEE